MERTNVKRIGLWGFLPLLLLVVGATLVGSCSSDDEDTATSPTDTTPTKQSLLVGKKWYRTKHEYLEFDANGNNNMLSSCRYVVDEKNDRILFYNKSDGSLYDFINIFEITDSTLSIGKTSMTTYTTRQPKQLCERLQISLPNNRITIKVGEKVQLPIFIVPDDADDQSVTLRSDNEGVVKTEGEYLIAVSAGETTVRVTTNDGSRLQTSCQVIVPEEGLYPASTYQLGGITYPMIRPIDLGLPSGTMWADMNMGADAPYRMSQGFEGLFDVAPYVGDDWQYPTADDFRELTDNCDAELEREYSDFYQYRMGGNQYYQLVAAVFTSRINGAKLHLYAYTEIEDYDYMYPYCLQDGTTFSMVENVKECAPNPNDKALVNRVSRKLKEQDKKVLIRLVKKPKR